MKQEERHQLDTWLNDATFVHWANESNQTSIAYWENWLIQHPEMRELAEVGRQMIVGLPFQSIPVDSTENREQLSSLWDQIRMEQHLQASAETPVRRLFPSTFLKIAAVVSFLLITTVGSWYWLDQNSQIRYQTDYSQTKTIYLADGSEVQLNANSSLHYQKKNPRKIWLEGEAFFKVAKKPVTKAKFWVHTSDLVVEVLGTSFNVKSRYEQTEVFLEEGKVALDLGTNEKVALDPGEFLCYSSKSDKKFVKRKAHPQPHISWKEGVSHLESMALYKILEEFETIYGINIDLRNKSLSEKVLTVAFPIENMEIGLQTLEHALGIEIQQISQKNYYLD